jgi:hypothetical protein
MKLGIRLRTWWLLVLFSASAACAEGLVPVDAIEDPADSGPAVTGRDAATTRDSAAPAPPKDSSVADVAVDVAADSPPPPPPPPDTGPPPTQDCPAANGQYTIIYGLLLQGEGGALKPCPCSSGECCYTPPLPIGPAACLPMIGP